MGVKVTSHIGREKTGGDLFLTICDYEWKPLGFCRGLMGGVFARVLEETGLSTCGAWLSSLSGRGGMPMPLRARGVGAARMNWPGQPDGFRNAMSRRSERRKAVRPLIETGGYTIIPRAIVARTIVLALPPAAERAFHIAEPVSNSRSRPFSPLENLFCIAKIAAYLIEKQQKFMSYVLYKTPPKAHRAALLFSHAVRFDIRSATLNHLLKRALLLGD
ncbi:hypothetical protein L2Y90_19550 [Burkholderia pyrrocinia]|uniref:hypothetical protein n=1 Tax=Burkholderia pyrrocinia TaxID=60550 RepID=UPI00215ABAED|nr:hypothetical protein [Burkholderia pyrrocinia]UVE68960.1 hypothetical protein L2Y90_19550 [Burkholderia pyrrocinia]